MHDSPCIHVLMFGSGMILCAILDIFYSIAVYFLEKARTERFDREGPQPSFFECLKNKFSSRTK